jgi:hypothetical protein
MYIFTIPTDLY